MTYLPLSVGLITEPLLTAAFRASSAINNPRPDPSRLARCHMILQVGSRSAARAPMGTAFRSRSRQRNRTRSGEPVPRPGGGLS